MDRKCFLVVAAVCFLSAGPAARADQIATEYSWGFKFPMGSNPVHTFMTSNSFATVIIPGNGGERNMLTAAGVSAHIDSKVWTASNATPSGPQYIHMPFAVQVKLTDNASGGTGFVTFRGWLSGDVWSTGSTLQPTFAGSLLQTVDINHHLYTVQFTSFDSPHGNFHSGQFNFYVKVVHNPEPSSLVLAGLGVPLVGLTLRRRRKKLTASLSNG